MRQSKKLIESERLRIRSLVFDAHTSESRLNCDDDPSVARDRRTSLVGHSENEVHGLRFIDLGGDQRNMRHILSQGQVDTVFVRPRFRVLKPEKTQAVAIRVASVSVQ